MPKPAEVTLPSDREVRVTRTFNAPRQLVWDAHTKPELVQQWQVGYDGWDMPVCDMDVRVGGKYRWQWKSREDGKQFGFFGTYIEVNAPSKIMHEEYYDPGDASFGMPTCERHELAEVHLFMASQRRLRRRRISPFSLESKLRCAVIRGMIAPGRLQSLDNSVAPALWL